MVNELRNPWNTAVLSAAAQSLTVLQSVSGGQVSSDPGAGVGWEWSLSWVLCRKPYRALLSLLQLTAKKNIVTKAAAMPSTQSTVTPANNI